MNALHVTQQIFTDIEAGRFQHFQEWGEGGSNPLLDQFFFPKLQENENIWTDGGGRAWDAPIHLSMHTLAKIQEGMLAPFGPISFILKAVFVKNFAKQQVAPPPLGLPLSVWEILNPPLRHTRHL